MTQVRTVEVSMPTLHEGQLAVHEARNAYRFRVLVAGRRWRKTSLGVAECLIVGASGGRAWWVAPIYEQAMIGWRMMVAAVATLPGIEIREGEHSITFPGGGIIRARTADNPDSLRGEGLDFVVLDEAAMMQERVWTEVLRPALTDRQGSALFISTPKGRNWFWRLFSDAERTPGWKRWQFASSTNPALSREELASERLRAPARVWAQEYEAQFVDDVGAVFRNIANCVHGAYEAAKPGKRYVAGLDLARVNDWTVLTIADVETKRVVHFDRWQLADWAVTNSRVSDLTNGYNKCPVYVDATGLGDVVVQQLRTAGVNVVPFVLTGDHGEKQGSKSELINALILALERETVRFPANEVLQDELQAYEYKVTKAGNTSTGAPDGYHDDCVISLGLCNWGLEHGSKAGKPSKAYSFERRG